MYARRVLKERLLLSMLLPVTSFAMIYIFFTFNYLVLLPLLEVLDVSSNYIILIEFI